MAQVEMDVGGGGGGCDTSWGCSWRLRWERVEQIQRGRPVGTGRASATWRAGGPYDSGRRLRHRLRALLDRLLLHPSDNSGVDGIFFWGGAGGTPRALKGYHAPPQGF